MRAVSTGRALQLGAELARGGEGAVYRLAAAPGTLAKIYNTPPSRERVAKLRAMVAVPPPDRPGGTGWPLDLVEAEGAVRGFTMPFIPDRQELHAVWSGASRRALFPQADYAMLVATAANLCRAVAGVHAAGLVIGDVNERCALAGADGTVALIDCDSFQLGPHACDVATPMYQPPELQGVATYRGLARTRNHDAFGLAVLIFQILFFARHPFAGRPTAGEAPEIPQAIAAFQFAWVEGTGLLRPPRTLPLAATGPDVARLFARAFSREGVSAGRPTAESWARALDALGRRLQPCAFTPAHQHLPVAGECPLCALEAETGGELFAIGAVRTRGAGNPEREAEELWAAIAALHPPAAKPPIPAPRSYRMTGRPYPAVDATGVVRLLQRMGVLATAQEKERAARIAAVRLAQDDYARLAATWSVLDPVSVWQTEHAMLAAARTELLRGFAGRRQEIEQASSRADLQRYLGSLALDSAAIRGIGRQRIQTLRAHGITTAADISAAALRSIPGFGPALKAALEAWRTTKELAFRPPRGEARLPPPAEVRRIDARYADSIGKRLGTLRGGADRLRRIAAEEGAKLDRAHAALVDAARRLAQAEADLGADAVASGGRIRIGP